MKLEEISKIATKDILEKNLKIYDLSLKDKKIVLVYDLESELTKIVANWYIENLKNNKNAIIINIDEIDKEDLKNLLFWLEENSMVIMVQSRNFRLDEFRIRLNLKNSNIWCIEHNHLIYIKESEYETYLKAISYKWDFYERLSNNLKNRFEKWDKLEVFWPNGARLEITWGFEDMKQNTWNFEIENRYWTYPVWENFTESKDFSKMNWEFYVRLFPWFDFQINFCDPVKITVKESIINEIWDNAPQEFLNVINKIKESEWEVMIRELGFWLNSSITFNSIISDINAFERLEGFHMSLWKKHNIYRKKLHKDIVQRYHIDIFPYVEEIRLDDEVIFNWGRFVV